MNDLQKKKKTLAKVAFQEMGLGKTVEVLSLILMSGYLSCIHIGL